MQYIKLISSWEAEQMRFAGKEAAALLAHLHKIIQPGISTSHIDDAALQWTSERGYGHGPKGYKGYPRHICTSVNDVVCHGIPSSEVILQEGDIINVDVTPLIGSYHGDTSQTFAVGNISEEKSNLIKIVNEALKAGIAAVKPGGYLGDIGAAIQAIAEPAGYSVVKEFCGHFIGRNMHDYPSIPHFGRKGSGFRFEPGMAFTIEPMINAGSPKIKLLSDGWTVKTQDGMMSAQAEHTVLVIESGVEVLTKNEQLGF